MTRIHITSIEEAPSFTTTPGKIAMEHQAEVRQLTAESRAAAGETDLDEPEYDPGQRGPCPGHEWAFTGTAYGGDDERFCGEGRAYCVHCGADGDA